jgi:hypothetical protein
MWQKRRLATVTLPGPETGVMASEKLGGRTMKKMRGGTMKRTFGLLCVLVFAAYVMMTWASTPVGVTPTLIGRGTFSAFKVKSDNSAFKFKASLASDKEKSDDSKSMASVEPVADFVVRTNDYAPGSSTGWHTHPGPVFITVTLGEVTFYEVDDPTCTPKVVREGQGYVDSGHGHIGRNETGNPAKDVVVAIAPVGLPFRNELPAPGPYCAF